MCKCGNKCSIDCDWLFFICIDSCLLADSMMAQTSFSVGPALTTARNNLQTAGQHVDSFINQDKTYNELAQLLNVTSSGE